MSEPAWVPLGGAAGVDVGPEVAYAEAAADVTVSATTEATANTIVTAPAFVADGNSQYMVEFFSMAAWPPPTAAAVLLITFFLDGVSLGTAAFCRNNAAAVTAYPVRLTRRITPAAGSRVLSARAYVTTGTGTVSTGPGGPAQNLPCFIRVTKVPTGAVIPGLVGVVPPGTVTQFAGASAPNDWLLCQGQAVSRVTYAALFAAISTAYGVGDGSTTFNVPDTRGRMPVGLGTAGAVDALGDNEGVGTVAQRRPYHRHTPHTHAVQDPDTNPIYRGGATSAGNSTVSTTTALLTHALRTNAVDGGSGVATDSLDAPAFLTFNYIIKT